MAEDRAACVEQAVGLLACREHSPKELARKLAKRGYDDAVIRAALAELQATRQLSADRFVESLVTSRVAKGQGPVRIRHELSEHGIDAAGYPELLAAPDWPALAREVRLKRFGAEPPEDFKARARQMRFLQYRGFERDQINAALDLKDD